MIPQLRHDVLLHHGSAVEVLSVGRVVSATIGDDALDVSDEKPLVTVIVGLQPLGHGLQIHRVLDVVVVVCHNLAIDGDKEWPCGLVVLCRIKDRLECVVQHVWIVGGT